MSESLQIWMFLWNRAAADPSPFEIDSVVPAIAALLGRSQPDTQWATSGLLRELDRMPDGRQYFTVEGNAVVPLQEFLDSPKHEKAALDAYPFEL